jgi:para-aminobenzoate synthetase/4-amino-4-deoxychorismate lyase
MPTSIHARTDCATPIFGPAARRRALCEHRRVPAPSARFDDLVAGLAWRFGAPRRVVRADAIEDVVPLLREVDAATASGAWAYGYLGYEAAPAFDPALLVRPRAAGDPPLGWFALCDPPAADRPVHAPPEHEPGTWGAETTAAAFAADVDAVRAEIGAGRVYQANLTTRLRGRVTDSGATYAALAHAQGGAYNALIDIGSHVIASASPELFFEWTDVGLLTRPMKGTAARGATGEADERNRAGLLGSAKERAENVMIVDLLRNDLSRIAATGSVRVPALLRAEAYGTVWQLTSDVVAVPLADATLADVFGALFPSGSVTGAPKAAAMRLIARLERSPRGVYCGAIGMIAPPGAPFRARFSVAIRTAVIARDGTAEYGAGSGVTWGSRPAAEHAETLLKAAVLLGREADGTRLLETMRHEPGAGVRNLERHLQRLTGSAARLGFACDESAIRARIADLDANGAGGPRRVRLLLARDGTVTLEHTPFVGTAGPVRLGVDSRPVPPPDEWCRHKSTRRLRYEAAAARRPDADDVALIDTDGRLIETTIANLAVELDGRWWTPPADSGCLPGVERARLLEAGVLAERTLTVADLRRARGIAVLSSLRGWRPASLLSAPAARREPSIRRR